MAGALDAPPVSTWLSSLHRDGGSYQGSSSPVYVKNRPCRSLPLPSTAIVEGRGRPGGSRQRPSGPPPQPPCPASRGRRARAAGRAARAAGRTPRLTRQQALGALFGRDVAVGVGVRQHCACLRAREGGAHWRRLASQPSSQSLAPGCRVRPGPRALRCARCASPPAPLPAHLPVSSPGCRATHVTPWPASATSMCRVTAAQGGWTAGGQRGRLAGAAPPCAPAWLGRGRVRGKRLEAAGGVITPHHPLMASWRHQDASLTHVQSCLGCAVCVAGGQRGSASYECSHTDAARRRCLLATTGRAASQGACLSTAALTAVGGREAQPRRGQSIL